MDKKEQIISVANSLDYMFEKYLETVKRGKPHLRSANLVKTMIDAIQVKALME